MFLFLIAYIFYAKEIECHREVFNDNQKNKTIWISLNSELIDLTISIRENRGNSCLQRILSKIIGDEWVGDLNEIEIDLKWPIVMLPSNFCNRQIILQLATKRNDKIKVGEPIVYFSSIEVDELFVVVEFRTRSDDDPISSNFLIEKGVDTTLKVHIQYENENKTTLLEDNKSADRGEEFLENLNSMKEDFGEKSQYFEANSGLPEYESSSEGSKFDESDFSGSVLIIFK